jgi:transposase
MRDHRGQYPAELRQRAVRLVAESKGEYESEWAAITSIAAKLGIGTAETLRKWVLQAESTAASERASLARSQRRSVGSSESWPSCGRANEILKAADCAPAPVRAFAHCQLCGRPWDRTSDLSGVKTDGPQAADQRKREPPAETRCSSQQLWAVERGSAQLTAPCCSQPAPPATSIPRRVSCGAAARRRGRRVDRHSTSGQPGLKRQDLPNRGSLGRHD